VFLEITGDGLFEPETQVLRNPRDVRTGAYYIHPFGWPVIECFFGGEGARMMAEGGPEAGVVHAREELAALFGSGCVASCGRWPPLAEPKPACRRRL